MARLGGGRLSRNVLQKLGRRIVSAASDRIEPLAGIPDLARQYGVSRTLVREVVRVMTAKGLLTSRPGVGVLIEAESNWDLFDPDVLYWLTDRPVSQSVLCDLAHFRLALEPDAAALAAIGASAEQKQSIQMATERAVVAERSSGDGVDDRIGFHNSILLASGNCFFSRLSAVVEPSLRMRRRIDGPDAERRLPSLYLEVCNTILAADPVSARQAMRAALLEEVPAAEEAPACELRSPARRIAP